MPRHRAGKRRHWVTLERHVEIEDGHGGFVGQWQSLGSVAAQVEGLDGREAVIGLAFQGVRHFRITMIYRADITAADRAVLEDGTELNIRSVTDPEGRRRELQILADTGSAAEGD